jgi:outer membrane protein TolC
LHGAFADVENALTNEQSLRIQYQATRAAQDNALAAQSLAFEQYQRGLVNYTTVLNAQQRAFNAQSSLIRLTNQLLSNRIDLHLALGGDFSSTVQNQQDNAHNE